MFDYSSFALQGFTKEKKPFQLLFKIPDMNAFKDNYGLDILNDGLDLGILCYPTNHNSIIFSNFIGIYFKKVIYF